MTTPEQREWMTPEEAELIVHRTVTAMIDEGHGLKVINMIRDHLRATLSPLVRVEAETEVQP